MGRRKLPMVTVPIRPDLRLRPTEGIERLPPHNLEAEEAVLGSALLDRETIGRLVGHLHDHDFYRERHGLIYGAMVALFERGAPVDYLTLVDELERTETLERAGGAIFLSGLIGAVPTPIHAEHYAGLIADAAFMRRLISAGGKIAAVGFGNRLDTDAALAAAEAALAAACGARAAAGFVPWLEILQGYLAELGTLGAPGDGARGYGLLSGFIDLDRKTNGGFQRGDLIILAGRPGMGKTALALAIATNAAVGMRAPVALFSLEMNRGQIAARIVSAESRIDSARLRRGALSDEEVARLGPALGRLSGMPLYIDDTGAHTVTSIRARARRLMASSPVQLLIVDHLQLVSSGRKTENRVQEVAEVSRKLKELAGELQIPILALSQLSRAVDSRPDKRPILSDLRDSGSLEQDADLVLMIYRDGYYHKDSDQQNTVELEIAKHRNGATGNIGLHFDLPTGRFHDLELTGRPIAP